MSVAGGTDKTFRLLMGVCIMESLFTKLVRNNSIILFFICSRSLVDSCYYLYQQKKYKNIVLHSQGVEKGILRVVKGIFVSRECLISVRVKCLMFFLRP